MPPFTTLQVALAGHPPPAIAVPRQPTVLAAVEAGPPLGVDSASVRSSASIALTPDTVVVFYTDGLVERRGESIDDGLRRLRAVTETGSANVVARDIMRALVADAVPDDDIALVVLRRLDVRDG
jgi:serine phosphatase RsbU (regulator of sigma subunit)